VTLLHDATGAVWDIGAILRHVTQRWVQQRARQRELQELKRRLTELER
jgi:hypothetical protein